MSLSQDAVLQVLKANFVCGYKNITGESYAGRSGHHDPDAPAVYTTNGAGPHNVQLFLLAPDGTVLHCLPGYWAAQDLIYEMRFALSLYPVWKNDSLSPETKKKLFAAAQLQGLRQHPRDMMERSHLQSFDAKAEQAKPNSDFRFRPGDYRPPWHLGKHDALKTTDQVVHERMAQQPFVPYEDFDVEKFTDYGKMLYDKKEETREASAKGTMMKKK